MIIQSDNHPSVLLLDEDISAWPAVECALYSGYDELKRWRKSDMAFEQVDDGYSITLPWTQSETANLPDGIVKWELKALDDEGLTQFWVETSDAVVSRRNTEVLV